MNDRLGGGNGAFRAVMATGESHGMDEITGLMRDRGCAVDGATIAYVVRCLAETVPQIIAHDGRRCNIGELISFYPVIRGTFPAANAKFNPARNTVEIAATVPAGLRRALDRIAPVNTTKR